MIKGYAVIQLPEYLLWLFNYLKKRVKKHFLYVNRAMDSDITTQCNKTVTSKVIVKPKDAPILLERVNSIELTVKNIERELEEIRNLISLK